MNFTPFEIFSFGVFAGVFLTLFVVCAIVRRNEQ